MKSIEPPVCRCPDDDGCGHVEPFPLPERAPLVAPATAKHLRIDAEPVDLTSKVETMLAPARDASARAAFERYCERILALGWEEYEFMLPWEELGHDAREVWREVAQAAIASAFGRLADGR